MRSRQEFPLERTDADGRELAYRAVDGLEGSLVWDPTDDALMVVVTDTRTSAAFGFSPEKSRALDAFYHPFAYASRRKAMPRPVHGTTQHLRGLAAHRRSRPTTR